MNLQPYNLKIIDLYTEPLELFPSLETLVEVNSTLMAQ